MGASGGGQTACDGLPTGAARGAKPPGQVAHRRGTLPRVFSQAVADALGQHVRDIGRPMVQVVDRGGLSGAQSGHRIAASQWRPAAENVPPHAAASEKIARHGRRRAFRDPLRSKAIASVRHQIVAGNPLVWANQASQARLGKIDLAVFPDKDVLYADITMDHSGSLQGD